ncbi:cis-golgi transport protein particle complex subunit [Xylariaceae sp. FL1019]|nr:cis-golgi transport protein particle complex subunit [Xylariaceae sp. FL1019]
MQQQPFSSSKVTVEYFDPHDVFKLIAPGLVPRLPLRNLHWQSHSGPLRSIDTLHVELNSADADAAANVDGSSVVSPVASPPPLPPAQHRPDSDGFQTQQLGAAATPKQSTDTVDHHTNSTTVPARRHQIPGLRRTPYLKVLLVRCDDNDSYKSHIRQEIRDWIKANTLPLTAARKTNTAENHDAFEWLLVHVVIPNTVAATQPRKSDAASGLDKVPSSSRWRPGSSTLLEKLRSDFNSATKSALDRVVQIRIGVNDVPYDILPRVIPAVPSGYTESEQDTENAWSDLIQKFRSLILSSFDLRVAQYEEDIKEKDAQRTLPGWNFCTFFILKEGLALGFESVGLVEDALVGYDELSLGLDMVIKDQVLGDSGSATNVFPTCTQELKRIALKAKAARTGPQYEDDDDDELVDLQKSQSAGSEASTKDLHDDIPISANKKPYRDLIVANNVSLFDFRCYIFARQMSLLLRLGNAWSTREELLTKLREQQESVLHGVAPRAPPPKHKENEQEELPMLSEICRRTLEFIPSVSQVMRRDVLSTLVSSTSRGSDAEPTVQLNPSINDVVDNLVASFAFSIAQQSLAQTSTKALPIPPSSLGPPDGHEPKAAIPEPKTMMHPARSSSLNVRTGGSGVPNPPLSPGIFPGRTADQQSQPASFLKAGLEDLAARRAELYALSRNILEELGKKRGWTSGWNQVPIIGESVMISMVDIDLGEERSTAIQPMPKPLVSTCGMDNKLLRTALDNEDDFYRLYEILTDKSLRHYTVANHTHSIQTTMADLAVLKYLLGDYNTASSYFWRTTPFFGESGWSLLELSMLIMYCRCLKKLDRRDEYVKVLLKLLSKAAAAEKDRRQANASFLARSDTFRGNDAIEGLLIDLLQESRALTNELRVPLSNFFSSIEIDGPPEYDQDRDSQTIKLKLDSLLVDELNLDTANVRFVDPDSKPPKEIWFTHDGQISIKPGKSRLKLRSNTSIPGSYEIDRLDLIAGKLCLHFGREFGDRDDSFLKSSSVSLYHRTDTLDVSLFPSKHMQLDRNNTVEIELNSGWNDLRTTEIRVKAATGGLRLLTSEAKCLHPLIVLSQVTEVGLFSFKAISPETKVRIRFPYTLEQDTPNISIRIEVTYETEHGLYTYLKTPTIYTALALGVNVQDVFKHHALFSRFTVSTANCSPLRLLQSELIESDMFDSTFGAPLKPVTIFPKQPACLLYKINRKTGAKNGPKTSKTMYLKLLYSVLHDEVTEAIEASLLKALGRTPLRSLSRLLLSAVLPLVQNDLTGADLERAALMGYIPTSFISRINCGRLFKRLGYDHSGVDLSASLVSFLQAWHKEHPTILLPATQPDEPSSILIPVDIPSVTVVHTADIRLTLPATTTSANLLSADVATPLCTGQLVPATLHLRWTRIWNTATPLSKQSDLEFSYEVSAPQDNWLLGGRRKGHFVIPAPGDTDEQSACSSSIDTEAEIPIILIPLREGWVPYPSVDIREVHSDANDGTKSEARGSGSDQFETEFKNVGENVRVIADHAKVTLSLDASGPAGGPLVLNSKTREVEGRVLVA